MTRTLVTLAAAGAFGAATLMPTQPAQAMAWWVAPAIIGGVVGGVALGTAVSSAYADPRLPSTAYPSGTVSVRPVSNCYVTQERIRGRIRNVEICR
jgi:hypothetical protein